MSGCFRFAVFCLKTQQKGNNQSLIVFNQQPTHEDIGGKARRKGALRRLTHR
jgi:hypothetical protein